jgi:hypothetical protein
MMLPELPEEFVARHSVGGGRRRRRHSHRERLDMAFGKKCRTAKERKRRQAIVAQNRAELTLW